MASEIHPAAGAHRNYGVVPDASCVRYCVDLLVDAEVQLRRTSTMVCDAMGNLFCCVGAPPFSRDGLVKLLI